MNKNKLQSTHFSGLLILIIVCCAFLIPVFFMILDNLIKLTYAGGYYGLIIRLCIMILLPILIFCGVILVSKSREKQLGRGFLAERLIIALIISLCLMIYYGFTGTLKDLLSEPVTRQYVFSISQVSGEGRFVINSFDKKHPHFKMSLFEVVHDANGNVIFTPFHTRGKLNISLSGKFWSSNYYR